MSAKQDRALPRTPQDLERRYKLSNTNKPFASSSGNYATLNDIYEKEAELRDEFNQKLDGYAADVEVIANDVYSHFEFLDGGTKVTGGFVATVLPVYTDLDSVTVPNKYIGGNVSDYEYINCPVSYGTFSLSVEACGEDGQLIQRLTSGSKDTSKTFERIFASSWGAWVCVTDFELINMPVKLLWSGSYIMNASQSVELIEPISAQKNGIVLVFADNSNITSDYASHTFFIHKLQLDITEERKHRFLLSSGMFDFVAAKTLFIYDSDIFGYADNEANGTGASGISYTNNAFVLQYVLGF